MKSISIQVLTLTSRLVHDHIIADLQAQIRDLRKNLHEIRNNEIVTLPVRSPDFLPEEAGEGEIVLGDNNKVYKYQNGEWSLIAAGIIDQVTTPGKLSIFTGTARSYMLSPGTVKLVHASVGVPSEGGNVTLELIKNGSDLVASPNIQGGFNVADSDSMIPNSDFATFIVDDYFTVNITGVGTDVRGKDLVVKIF